MDEDITTIQLTKPTRKRLNVWKTKHELTYDEAINELLDQQEDESE